LATAGEEWGVGPPWQERMDLMGSTNMKRLRELFISIEFWSLVLAPELPAEQPGRVAPEGSITRSAAEDLAVIYTPEGGKRSINMYRSKSPVSAE
jgi:hypothetical protein